MSRHLARFRAVALGAAILGVVAWLAPVRGLAQTVANGETEPWLALSVRGGAMASDDQRSVLRFDQEGATARLVAALRPLPWLAGELALGGLIVGGRLGLGALMDASLGLRAMPRLGSFTPYAAVSVGVGVTGLFVAPVLQGAVGLWLDVAGEWSFGPEVGVTHVVWEDGAQRTSDAVFLSLGLSLSFRPHASEGAPPRGRTVTVIRTRERVIHVTSPPPPLTDPAELMRLVDRAVPAATVRSITSMVPPLLFEHDRAALSSCGEASLFDLFAALREVPPDTRVIIEGHADETGDETYNRELSLRRAEAVRALLVEHGVPVERIELRAAGEREPLLDEHDARTLSLNRRVVVHLVRSASSAEVPR